MAHSQVAPAEDSPEQHGHVDYVGTDHARPDELQLPVEVPRPGGRRLAEHRDAAAGGAAAAAHRAGGGGEQPLRGEWNGRGGVRREGASHVTCMVQWFGA